MNSFKFVGAKRSAALAAACTLSLMTVGGASAADLGGDCCADLEERVAELEATTARKGNRKVSLTITGWVTEQVMWWDDGVESNVYVTGAGTTLASHFKMTGAAKISQDWSAGYLIHVETDTSDPLLNNQDNDDASVNINLKQSYWFLKSERLGKLSVGLLSPASDNTAILVDGSGSLVPANWVMFDNQGFFLNSNGIRQGTLTWSDISHCNTRGVTNPIGVAGDCGNGGVVGNFVRYDSPTFAGFSVSADWGEDDGWDVAARYAGEFNGVKVAVAASYYENNEYAAIIDKVSYFQIGAYIQHVPTGLFAYGAYGHENTDWLPAFADRPDSADNWYVKSGIRRKWSDLGHTVLFGEYGEKLDGMDQGAFAGTAIDSKLRHWGLGVVQEIDNAAMSLWLSYRNFDGNATIEDQGIERIDYDDMHVVKAGALIKF